MRATFRGGGFDKLRHFFPAGEHADLWHEIGKLVEARRNNGGTVRIVRTPAHLNEQSVLEGRVPFADWVGNHLVDALAGAGAARKGPGLGAIKSVSSWSAKQALVLRRLVDVNLEYVKTYRTSETGKPARRKNDSSAFLCKLKASGHCWPVYPKYKKQLPNAITCLRCLLS